MLFFRRTCLGNVKDLCLDCQFIKSTYKSWSGEYICWSTLLKRVLCHASKNYLTFNSSKSPHQIFSVDIHCDSILQILPSKNVYVSYTLILESNLYLAIMSLNYSSQILVTKLYTVILNASKHEINIKMSDLFVVLPF